MLFGRYTPPITYLVLAILYIYISRQYSEKHEMELTYPYIGVGLMYGMYSWYEYNMIKDEDEDDQ